MHDGTVESAAANMDVTVVTRTAPTATDREVETTEDTDYSFTESDFGLTEGAKFDGVIVTSLPASGTGGLKFDGTAITRTELPKTVTAAELGEDKLVYDPPATGTGEPFARFLFKVFEGTLDSAATLESATATMNIDVVTGTQANVCTGPDLAGRRQIWTGEVTVGTFEISGTTLGHGYGTSAFFSAGASLSEPMFDLGSNPYTIDSVYVHAAGAPTPGALTLSLTSRLTGTEVADLTVHVCSNAFAFAAARYVSGDQSYVWSSAGLDWALATSRTLYLSVARQNTAPTASESKITATANTDYAFAASEFKFSDDEGDALANVIVTSLPASTKGDLKFDGSVLTNADLPKTVTAAELGEDKLVYDPPASGTGTGFASFEFKVHDGTVESASAATMTIDLVANTAPEFAATTATRTFDENIGDTATSAEADLGAAFTATDANGDTPTYTLEGDDAPSFGIDAGTGQLKTRVGVVYDFEAQASYAVTVKANDGRGGTDTIAVTVTLTDQDELPLEVTTPTVTAQSATSLHVIWSAPDNAGRPAITSYDVQYRAGTTGAWLDGPQDVTGTSTMIAALEAGTSYEARVRATNDDGDGPWSTTPGSGSIAADEIPECAGDQTTTCDIVVGEVFEGGLSALLDGDYWRITLAAETAYQFKWQADDGVVLELYHQDGSNIDSIFETGQIYTVPPAKGGPYYIAFYADGGDNVYPYQYSGSVTLKISGPTVTSIERQSPSSSPTNEDALTWQVTFDEAVLNVDAADFTVSGTTATVTDASPIAGKTGVYAVTVSGGDLPTLDATVTLAFASVQDIENTAGETLSATTPTGENDDTYVVDNTAPTVEITGVALTSTAPFTATFSFSEAVTEFVVEDIALGNATASEFMATKRLGLYGADHTDYRWRGDGECGGGRGNRCRRQRQHGGDRGQVQLHRHRVQHRPGVHGHDRHPERGGEHGAGPGHRRAGGWHRR